MCPSHQNRGGLLAGAAVLKQRLWGDRAVYVIWLGLVVCFWCLVSFPGRAFGGHGVAAREPPSARMVLLRKGHPFEGGNRRPAASCPPQAPLFF